MKIIIVVIGIIVLVGVGAYLWEKYGSRVKKEAAREKADIKEFGSNVQSGVNSVVDSAKDAAAKIKGD